MNSPVDYWINLSVWSSFVHISGKEVFNLYSFYNCNLLRFFIFNHIFYQSTTEPFINTKHSSIEVWIIRHKISISLLQESVFLFQITL